MSRTFAAMTRPGTLLMLPGIVLWLASLLVPAIGARGGPTLSGFEVLLQGWSAWRYGVLSWFANPALIVAVAAAFGGRSRIAVRAAALGLLLACTSFWARELAALAGRSVPELSFAAGFYLWMAAHAAVLIGGIVSRVRTTRAS